MIQDLERLRSRPPITFSDLRFFFKSTPVKFPSLYLFPSFFPLLSRLAHTHIRVEKRESTEKRERRGGDGGGYPRVKF